MRHIPCNFWIQTEQRTPTKKIGLALINNKKNNQLVDFTVPANHKVTPPQKNPEMLDLARMQKICKI